MKKIVSFVLILNALLWASGSDDIDKEKKGRVEKQLKIEMEKEKKYAKEQTFYTKDNYDFKGAEVNVDSLSTLPDLEDDDFDMDSVYD